MNELPEMPRRLALRASEVADILSISRAKVYELMADGTLPVINIAGAKRVPVKALNDWVDAQ